MDYPNYDIIVVDDGSSDGSVEHLHRHYPEIRVIQLPGRSGHSKACNTGIAATDARYVYIIEHHTVVKKDTLSQLMHVMTSDEKAAICYSKQINVYSEDKMVVEGTRYAHFVVNQRCDRVPFTAGDDESTPPAPPVDVTSSGTFSYLLDKNKFDTIGYFDEEYFVHIADYELTLRAKAAGFKCYYVPASVSYHKSFVETAGTHNYRGGKDYPAFRTFVISRNRWLTILSHYALRTIVLLSPALVLYELILVAFVIRRRVFLAYLKAMAWLAVHPGSILKKRKHIQQMKRVSDADLLVAGELNFVPGLAQSRFEQAVIHAITRFLTGYWNLVKRWL
jgi:hypothetical protein